SRLSQIRSQRLETIGSTETADYAELDRIREEVADARLFFEQHNIPVIDVTRRSIEETAAEILVHLRARGVTSA
ncbi:MAG: kinase/pyrophosphorylase, partial [Pseudomonadota bacterium]